MHNGPVEISWDVHCPGAAVAEAVRELLRHEADLNAVQKASLTGGGTTTETSHRLGDYFQAIRVGPGAPTELHSLRDVFQRSPNAGRWWRDMMTRVLKSVSQVHPGITITMAYRR